MAKMRVTLTLMRTREKSERARLIQPVMLALLRQKAPLAAQLPRPKTVVNSCHLCNQVKARKVLRSLVKSILIF